MIDILNFLPDPIDAMAGLLEPLPSGSYLVIMQPAADERLAAALAERWNRISPVRVYLRGRATVEDWPRRLTRPGPWWQPGIVELDQWRPAPERPVSTRTGCRCHGAVGRKP